MTAEECRQQGRRLFVAFDACQQRLIQSEIILGLGRKNAEERARLQTVVAALRQWVPEAKELGILPEFECEIRLFISYLKHEADEAARAEKRELPWKLRLFIESGGDVTAPTSRPVQYVDYDPDRCLHPRM